MKLRTCIIKGHIKWQKNVLIYNAVLVWLFFQVARALQGDNVCTERQSYNLTKRIAYRAPVRVRSYVWCLAMPPRCSRWSTEMRDLTRLETDQKFVNMETCCEGFSQRNDECKPNCPPGKTGAKCDKGCNPGRWGASCGKSCSCPERSTCDPRTGECTCFRGWFRPRCNARVEQNTRKTETYIDWKSSTFPSFDVAPEGIVNNSTIVNETFKPNDLRMKLAPIHTTLNNENTTIQVIEPFRKPQINTVSTLLFENNPSTNVNTVKSTENKLSSNKQIANDNLSFIYSNESLNHGPNKNTYVPQTRIAISDAKDIDKNTHSLNLTLIKTTPKSSILLDITASNTYIKKSKDQNTTSNGKANNVATPSISKGTTAENTIVHLDATESLTSTKFPRISNNIPKSIIPIEQINNNTFVNKSFTSILNGLPGNVTQDRYVTQINRYFHTTPIISNINSATKSDSKFSYNSIDITKITKSGYEKGNSSIILHTENPFFGKNHSYSLNKTTISDIVTEKVMQTGTTKTVFYKTTQNYIKETFSPRKTTPYNINTIEVINESERHSSISSVRKNISDQTSFSSPPSVVEPTAITRLKIKNINGVNGHSRTYNNSTINKYNITFINPIYSNKISTSVVKSASSSSTPINNKFSTSNIINIQTSLPSPRLTTKLTPRRFPETFKTTKDFSITSRGTFEMLNETMAKLTPSKGMATNKSMVFVWLTTEAPVSSTKMSDTDPEEVFHILTEPEQMTSIAGDQYPGRKADNLVSVLSVAGGCVTVLIVVAVLIVILERRRKIRCDEINRINRSRIKAMMAEEDRHDSYVRSIFHSPLPEPPIQPYLSNGRGTFGDQFMRPVALHNEISPTMVENFRGILESHYDHLPPRNLRPPNWFLPIVATSMTGPNNLPSNGSISADASIDTLKMAREATIKEYQDSEPLYDEIPFWKTKRAQESLDVNNSEAVTVL